MSRVAQPRSSPVSRRDARSGGGGSGELVQDGELLPSRLHRMTLHAPSSHPAHAATSAVADPTPSVEICPVCKSSRYLKVNLRFLVNPECYHKMCESCVDRIFSHGPAQCPIPGCHHTLRKARFRQQTFDDIAVEREVDVRRRVAAVFSRREDEFETLRDYNDYLNDAEDITFNLINNIDPEETQRRFAAHREAHERDVAENADLAQQESLSFSARQRTERDQARQRREAARREDAEERKAVREGKRDALRKLENGESPGKVVHGEDEDGGGASGAAGVTLKKRMNRQAAAERAQSLQTTAESQNGSSDLVIKGLKAKVKAAPEAPVDPFGGLGLDGWRYFAPQEEYVWNVLQDARTDPLIGAGGYDVASFSHRALGEAFAGFGIFIADEMTERERAGQDVGSVGTVGAQVAATTATAPDVQMMDAF